MNIKRKMIGIFVCVILLTTIPLAAGLTVDEQDDPNTTKLGRGSIQGFVMFYRHVDGYVKFFALRLHYIYINGTERITGSITFRPCKIKADFLLGYLRSGPFGIVGYMFGTTFRGKIEY